MIKKKEDKLNVVTPINIIIFRQTKTTTMPATRINQANTDFKMADADFAIRAQTIHDGLASVAGLATFPTPPHLPAALQTAIDTFVAASAAAIDGSKAETQAKVSARRDLELMLRVDAKYVNQIAQNTLDNDQTRSQILISGYMLSNDPLPKNTLPQPDQFTAMVKVINRAPQPGIVSLRYKRSAIRDNRGYGTKWMYKTVAGVTWNEFSTSGASVDVSGLTSGTPYMFKCVQIGNKTTVVTESDTITVNVL